MVDGAGHDARVASGPGVASGGSPTEPPERRSLTEPLVAAGAAAASVVLVGAVYPRYPELFPSCPSRTLFGVWCPLCGGTSSASALATGRVPDAIRFNAFVPVLVLLTAWSWLAWVGRSVQRDWLPAVPRWLWTTVGVLWLAYGVLRNVPIEPFASLKP
jgi:hypothetical protein